MIDDIDLLMCDCGMTVTATFLIARRAAARTATEATMGAIIDDLVHPLLSVSTDAELAADHHTTISVVRAARRRLLADTRAADVRVLADEIAHEIGYDPTRPSGDLVLDVLRMFRDQARRRSI